MSEDPRETNGEDEKTKKIRELGKQLKELREAQGITLEQASEATKIQKKYISAIEDGELGTMPKGPYCRSFLRQYCALLNAPDMWAKYDPLTKSAPVVLEDLRAQRDEPDMSVTPGVFRRSPRFWIYLLVAASLAAAVWVTLRYRGEISLSATSPMRGGTAPIVREQQERQAASQDSQQEPPAAPAQETENTTQSEVDLSWMDGNPPADRSAAAPIVPPAAEQPQTPTQAPPASQPPAPAANQASSPAPSKETLLVLTAHDNSWMHISRDGRVLYQGIMKAGERREFRVEGPSPLRVRCGKPSATEAAWFGAPAKTLEGGSNPVTLYYWSDGAVTSTETR